MLSELRLRLCIPYYNFISWIKIIQKGRLFHRLSTKPTKLGDKLVILGNSSDASLFFENRDLFNDYDLLTVNWFPLKGDLFFSLKPKYICFKDPAFFSTKIETLDKENSLGDLITVLNKVDWDLSIVLPEGKTMMVTNNYIHYIWLSDASYSNESTKLQRKWFYKNYILPRSCNVASSALFFSEIFGYEEIALIGINLDWMKEYEVNEKNELWVRDTHFYGNKKIKRRDTYLKQLWMTAYTFQGFEEANKMANDKKIKIINYSPKSYLQMFEKREILSK